MHPLTSRRESDDWDRAVNDGNGGCMKEANHDGQHGGDGGNWGNRGGTGGQRNGGSASCKFLIKSK